MANDNSFRDTLDKWMDKAEQLLDNLREQTAQTGGRIGDAVQCLDEAARADKHEVRRGARQAQADLKDRSDEMRDRLDTWIDQIQERAKHSGDVSREQLERFKEKARRLKEEIRIDADNLGDEIKGRADRFDDGVDRIREDIKENMATGTHHANDTSPMDNEGDYRAADHRGTVNNYQERIDLHAEQTGERIRERVEEETEKMEEKLGEFGLRNK